MTDIKSRLSGSTGKGRELTACHESTPRVPRAGEHLIDRRLVADKAGSPLSAVPRPFLRWAGSKRWLLRHLVPLLPPRFRTYREPFLGSGALFFLLCPDRAVLSDKCGAIIEVYGALRDGVSTIIRHLKPLKPDRDLFYAIRNRPSRGRLRRVA